MFDRDRVAAQVTTFGGEHSSRGVEPVVTGVYRNLSFSVGYTRFETDGFRVNSGQTDDILNAFAQAEVTSQTSVQAEYRRRKNETGDMTSSFFPDLVQPGLTQRGSSDTYRLGARHAFAPGSIVVASAMYRQGHKRVQNVFENVLALDSDSETGAGGGELQHLYRSRFVSVVSGAGYFRSTGDARTVIPPIALEFSEKPRIWHANAYAYAHARLFKEATLTLGASADAFTTNDETLPNRRQLNPKLGVTWSPLAGTTVRAAAFRTLKRTLIADQTLEPTQVAGFNQLFDDATDTRTWVYGVAVDQKLTRDLHIGAEGARRDLDVAVVDPTSGRQQVDWREWDGRGYVFWSPHRRLAFRVEYFYERILGDERLTQGARDASTHRVPVGVALFLPHGIAASASAAFCRQEGTFVAPTASGFEAGADRFWVVDASLSWRLPGRHGIASVAATNLLDQKFKLFEQDSTSHTPTVLPVRTIFARFTLAGP
jgi:hypothetical protein